MDEQLEIDPELASAAEKVERERQDLLDGIIAGRDDTVERRVAIVLNRFPETRDSDLKLMLSYWELFEGYDGGLIHPAELFERARLNSLTRSRARIQNQYQLFQASPTIRKRRGKISEEEYQKALDTIERYPSFAVLLDESGKQGPHLIIGAVWFGDGQELFTLTRKLGEWREQRGFDKELHFKNLNADVAPFYAEALEVVLTHGTTVSFKAISVPKDGVRRIDDALEELTYQLLRRGVEHEHTTGRAPLPRSIQIWKDQENQGNDKLVLARLKDRLEIAGKAELDGKLATDEFVAVESHKSPLIQVADLFAASLNRVLNVENTGSAKDQFARHLLAEVGMPIGPDNEATIEGDLVAHIRL